MGDKPPKTDSFGDVGELEARLAKIESQVEELTIKMNALKVIDVSLEEPTDKVMGLHQSKYRAVPGIVKAGIKAAPVRGRMERRHIRLVHPYYDDPSTPRDHNVGLELRSRIVEGTIYYVVELCEDQGGGYEFTNLCDTIDPSIAARTLWTELDKYARRTGYHFIVWDVGDDA